MLRTLPRRLMPDQRGSMLPMMAVVLMVATAGGAIAVDLTRAYAFRDQLQLTADAAALAAAVNLPNVDAARRSAYLYAAKNMPDVRNIIGPDDIEFGSWDPDTRTIQTGTDTPSVLKVTVRLADVDGNALSTLFAGIFGNAMMDIAASAVAGKRSAMCIMALDPTGQAALALDVLAKIEALNCTAQVNSRDDRAFQILPGSTFMASGLCVTGNAFVGPLTSVAPEPTTGCLPQPDPLADLTPPEVGACSYRASRFDSYSGILQPGVYCGGLTIAGNSDVVLAAGIYVIKDGPLSTLDTSKVGGEEIMFFLTGSDAVIRFEDKSSLTLTAPTAGDMAGILVFQDRNYSGNHVWDSDAPTELYGTIYLPEGRLLSQSSNSITPISSCNVLIAKSLRFRFRSGVSIDLGQTRCQDYLPAAVLGAVALLG